MQEPVHPGGHGLSKVEGMLLHGALGSLRVCSLKRVPLSKILQFLGTQASFSIKLQQANEEREQRQPGI